MELHDKIMLPDLGKEAVLRSVKEAEYIRVMRSIPEIDYELYLYTV